MKLEFEEFRESMLDKLYDSDSTVFILKTNGDDIILVIEGVRFYYG